MTIREHVQSKTVNTMAMRKNLKIIMSPNAIATE